MWEAISQNLAAIVNSIVIVSTIIGAVLWSHNGLSKQIDEIRADTKLAHTRIDTTNQRIDRTYDLILKIVQDNKKEEKK